MVVAARPRALRRGARDRSCSRHHPLLLHRSSRNTEHLGGRRGESRWGWRGRWNV